MGLLTQSTGDGTKRGRGRRTWGALAITAMMSSMLIVGAQSSGAATTTTNLNAACVGVTDGDKELLNAKYQKLEANLQSLSRFLKDLEPRKELEARLAAQEEKLRKLEEELTIRRKVLTHEQEELEQGKDLAKAAEDALKTKEREIQEKLKNVDVVKRAKELDAQQSELEGKLTA